MPKKKHVLTFLHLISYPFCPSTGRGVSSHTVILQLYLQQYLPARYLEEYLRLTVTSLVMPASTTGSGMSARALESLSLPAHSHKKTLEQNTNRNIVRLQIQKHNSFSGVLKLLTKNARNCPYMELWSPN